MVLEEETTPRWAALHLSLRLRPPPLVASSASFCWLRLPRSLEHCPGLKGLPAALCDQLIPVYVKPSDGLKRDKPVVWKTLQSPQWKRPGLDSA